MFRSPLSSRLPKQKWLSPEIAKVGLVGEATVGKTFLARRFVLSEFDERSTPAVGEGSP